MIGFKTGIVTFEERYLTDDSSGRTLESWRNLRYSFGMISEEIKSKIAELARKRDLSMVVLFGSQATGLIHRASDKDIAGLGKGRLNLYELVSDFSKIFNRDDVQVADIDPNSASPTLMHAVVRDGKLLYEREAGVFLRWKLYAIKMWMETAWLRNLRDKKLIEWAESN